MGELRRPLRAALLPALLALSAAGQAAPGVVETRDLQADGALARSERLPIMLVLSRTECGYCEVLRDEVLTPMVAGEHDRGKVVLRELRLDHGTIRDFRGDPVDAEAFARRYRAYVTPTVLFLNASGREIAPRMLGINTVDFYFWYLEATIAQAREALLGER